MAATRIGQGTPLSSFTFSDTLDGGQSGSFIELWRSDAGDIDAAMAEIITAVEGTYGFTLGSSFSTAPYDKTVIVGREIKLAFDNDDIDYYHVIYTLGPRTRKTVAATADWVFTFSSSLSSAETNIDKNNAFITVGTIVGTPLAPAVPTATTVPKTGAQVEKMFPSIRISASGSLAANPFSSYKDMVGKLNSVAMTIDGQTLAIGTTMLVAADVQTPNDGTNYVVNYAFEYRPNKYDWEAVVVAIDPKTGKPYEGIDGTTFSDGTTRGGSTIAEGSKGYAIYDVADIGSLITV
jgi:hypothetical protein